jgi:hypothetical protein
MADDTQIELAALRLAVERLTQGLQLMLETQATHTEMLRQLQEAAAAEPEPSPVADTLAQLAATLRHHSEVLEGVRVGLEGLPGEVGSAVAQGMRAALAGVA